MAVKNYWLSIRHIENYMGITKNSGQAVLAEDLGMYWVAAKPLSWDWHKMLCFPRHGCVWCYYLTDKSQDVLWTEYKFNLKICVCVYKHLYLTTVASAVQWQCSQDTKR